MECLGRADGERPKGQVGRKLKLHGRCLGGLESVQDVHVLGSMSERLNSFVHVLEICTLTWLLFGSVLEHQMGTRVRNRK